MKKRNHELPKVPLYRHVFAETIYGVDVRYELHRPPAMPIPEVIEEPFWMKNHPDSEKAFRRWFVFNNKKDFEQFFMEHQGSVPPLKEWREADEGDWVIADDGGICEIIRRNKMGKTGDDYIRTIVGTFLFHPKTPNRKDKMPFFMDTDFRLHPNRSAFNAKTVRSLEEYIKNRKKVTQREKIFAHDVAHGVKLIEAYKDCYPSDNTAKTEILEKRALLLYNQERVQKEVSKNLEEIFKAKGIDHDFIIEKMKLYMEKMEKEGDIRGAKEALKDLAKGIGTFNPDLAKIKEGGMLSVVKRFALDGDVAEFEEGTKQIEEKKDE